MKKRVLSWGLILSLLLTMLPVSTIAAEGERSGDSRSVTESTQCICGGQPDETGIITHIKGCTQAAQEPVPGAEEPTQEKEEPTPATAPTISLITDSVTVTEGDTGLDEPWLQELILSGSSTVTISPKRIDAAIPGTHTVTYTASADGFTDVTAALTVTVLPRLVALAAGEHNGHNGWTKLIGSTNGLSVRVYLETDITASGAITVTDTTTLCLNGHVLNLNGNNITVCSSGVNVFGLNTLTNFLLSGGSITDNHAGGYSGGGVYLSSSSCGAAFELSGKPDISGNTAGSNRTPPIYI